MPCTVYMFLDCCRSVFFHSSQLRESPCDSCCACLNDSWGQTAAHAKLLRQSSSWVFLCDSCGQSRCCTILSCPNGSWKESSYERMAVGMELLLCRDTCWQSSCRSDLSDSWGQSSFAATVWHNSCFCLSDICGRITMSPVWDAAGATSFDIPEW